MAGSGLVAFIKGNVGNAFKKKFSSHKHNFLFNMKRKKSLVYPELLMQGVFFVTESAHWADSDSRLQCPDGMCVSVCAIAVNLLSSEAETSGQSASLILAFQ